MDTTRRAFLVGLCGAAAAAALPLGQIGQGAPREPALDLAGAKDGTSVVVIDGRTREVVDVVAVPAWDPQAELEYLARVRGVKLNHAEWPFTVARPVGSPPLAEAVAALEARAGLLAPRSW